MAHRRVLPSLAASILMTLASAAPGAESVLPKTEPLTAPGDLSESMVAGIDRFLMAETERSVGERRAQWLEFFNGAQTINGVGTFQLLHHHLRWPEPK